MNEETRSPRLSMHQRLVLTQLAITVAAVLVAEGGAQAMMATAGPGSRWAVRLVLAGLVGLLGSLWAGRSLAHRLDHMLETGQNWLRGNLSLRIADDRSDDLSWLAGRLDLLAGQLERDERDLVELRERNSRLVDQVRALAVVEERNRLARELHDGVKQYLFSLGMTASAIRDRLDGLLTAQEGIPPELAEMAREVEATALAAQREMTRLISDLRPVSLQEQGLAAALNDYTLLFGAREHLLVYLDIQGDDRLLTPSVGEALYRVAQEALHNIAHHARATRVDMQLRCFSGQVALSVRDNGKGFDTRRSNNGLGLANMQERMMAVGGRLSIESRPGVGTAILAEVELDGPLGIPAEPGNLQAAEASSSIENWAWLGQKLVIPVGQTWPWHPSDQMHLRRPLVEPCPEPLVVKKSATILGLSQRYALHLGLHQPALVRILRSSWGYRWELFGEEWALQHLRPSSGKTLLTRNGQPLAAMQYQGRLLNTWSEIIYDGHNYCLVYAGELPGTYSLRDEAGDDLLAVHCVPSFQLELRRALPLPLLVMVVARILEERTTAEAIKAAT